MKPAKGTITFLGERIDELPPHDIVKRGIAHCPERRKLFPEMTVMENLKLGAYSRKDSEKIQKDLETMITLFPLLEERKSQEARTLSGGEQQMLAIARGLMSDPKLLMLDEPSLGLAPIIREKLIHAIHEIKRSGVTILMVEQDVGLALSLCDRGYVFEEGGVCMEGSRRFLKGNPKIKEAYEKMMQRFRDYLVSELELYRKAGIVKANDTKMAADTIVTLMEGLEFHTHFLSEEQPFENFANYAKNLVISMLKDETLSSNIGNSSKSFVDNHRRYSHD